MTAPGESKIPTNLLRERNWGINAFPNLYPTGRYGTDYNRPIKITMQQFITQRTGIVIKGLQETHH